jgi:hypothetical protein
MIGIAISAVSAGVGGGHDHALGWSKVGSLMFIKEKLSATALSPRAQHSTVSKRLPPDHQFHLGHPAPMRFRNSGIPSADTPYHLAVSSNKLVREHKQMPPPWKWRAGQQWLEAAFSRHTVSFVVVQIMQYGKVEGNKDISCRTNHHAKRPWLWFLKANPRHTRQNIPTKQVLQPHQPCLFDYSSIYE